MIQKKEILDSNKEDQNFDLKSDLIKKYKKTNKIKNKDECLVCGKSKFKLVFLNLFIIFVFFMLIYFLFNNPNYYDKKGFGYSLKRQLLTNNIEFNLVIKNVSKFTLHLENNKKYIRILDENQNLVFQKDIIVAKTEFLSDQVYVEKIIINKNRLGKYKLILALDDMNTIEENFNIN